MAYALPGRRRPLRRRPSRFTGLDVDAVRSLVHGLLLLFWFTLPWEGVIRVGGSATLARAVGAVLTVAALAALAIGGRRTRPGDVVWLMAVLAALVLASLMWTVTPGPTHQRVVTMLQLLVMVAVTWEFAHSRRRVHHLMNAWLVGCVVVGLVACWAFLNGQAETRYSAPGTSPGNVAYALLIGVPIAWYLGLRARRATAVWLYRLYVPFACLGVVLTASRAGLITMGVSLLIIPLTLGWLAPRGRIGVGLAALGALALAVPLAAVAVGPIARLSTTSTEISTGTLDHRTTLWEIGFRLIRDHPILGLGAGGSKAAVSGQFEAAKGLHNTFLSVTVELGLLGLAVFGLLLVAGFYRALSGLPPLETRMMWVTLVVFGVSLSTRHADYTKSTYALITLFALIGHLLGPEPTGRPIETDPVATGPVATDPVETDPARADRPGPVSPVVPPRP
ncbi:MAG: O-antigen ligase family protein [Nocardioides sp.]|uniref:O-antigen ligase family protein n=1 Tax=Nocardioides sp. TaxID=35761 RepID=UPI0039E2AE5E